jgi:nucleotide-binding universal stress UspA family protein
MSGYPVFRSIVVPVDGSPLAEGAIAYALALAERTHSKVQFVLVHPDQYPPLLIEPARRYLSELTERYRSRLGASLSSMILTGAPAASLVRHIREIGADLVVMS